MMRRRLITNTLLILSSLVLFSCTSVDTQDEESMMNMDSEISSDQASADTEFGSEDFADDFSADFADGDFGDEDFGGEDFSGAGGDQAGVAGEEFPEEDFSFEENFEEQPQTEVSEAPAPEIQEPLFDAPVSEVPSAEEFTGPVESEIPAPSFSPVTPSQITNIRYNASPGGGNLIVEGDRPLNYQTRFNEQTNQFIIEIPGAVLPENLKRPFLMKEFRDAKFGAVNAYQKPGSNTARIVVQLKNSAAGEPLVEVRGNSLNIIPISSGLVAETNGSSPVDGSGFLTPEPDAFANGQTPSADFSSNSRDERILGARNLNEFLMGNNKFYGRPISIQIKDADIRDVLNFIADESGSNIVVSDDVKGRVTIKLRQVPWDQALVTIMRANKLGYVRQGSVIRISQLDALKEETQTATEMLKAQKSLRPLRVKVIPVSFARVEDLVVQFKDFITKDRGSIIADPRTSSIIVTDDEEVIERISRLIKELDIAPAQVMIEGKVVEAGENFVQNVGVNWGFSGTDISLGNGRFGEINLSPDLNVRTVAPEIVTEGNFKLGFNIGTMDVLGDLASTLALAESDSLLKIISSPRIVAMNKEKATIKQEGEQVTISTVTDQTGNITRGVQRTPIVVQLTVTPQITNDANVILDVEVEREFAGPLLDSFTQARAINSRSAKTKILVRNGQTAVIGGIYQSDSTENITGVPVLKDIPVLGWLFKSRNKDFVKNELLIFLTPRILNSTTENTKL